MSYVVLARKYRPMRFADMVGQEHVGRTLANAIRQGRVHHAYLFAGARGLGKTTTARIFAKALVCERGPTAEPCNECSQCVMVTEGRSVDVVEIDGASNNSVENIRNLREQVHYLPQSARRKVYIIDEVHMLTTSAFNALLKTLEEPPAHVNFVFATTEPHKLLPTILSRVSRLDFRRVSSTEIVAHLQSILEKEGLGVEPAGLRAIARASGGSVRDAMTLLDQVVAFAEDAKHVGEVEVRAVLGQADRPAVMDLVDALLARDPDRVLARFDALAAAGLDLTVLSVQMLEDLRDLTVARVCKQHEAFVDATAEELAELRKRASVLDPSSLAQTFDRLTRIVERLPTSRSQRLVLEMGLLELAQSEPVVPLGDLIDRLQALGSEGSSGGGGGPSGAAERGGSRAPARGGPARTDRRALEPGAAPSLAHADGPAQV
ncbi:MAG TPA: DNA polymerase III subunit gamma/tau, partial [Nannocystaceae bacterium]|nr:DNA polymerase III subunit gamma/tau [Nannocystaceae bacterium]